MDNIVEIAFVVIFLLFSVVGLFRRVTEGRDVEKRKQESDWTVGDLPEETRRMLFGEKTPPTAAPAKPKQSADPFTEVRDMFNEVRRQIEVQTAKPRQSAPKPQQPPALPSQPAQAPRRPHPQQPEFRPAQSPPRQAVPQRMGPRPQQPRMVPQQSEGSMRREVQPPKPPPVPMARRQQTPQRVAQRRLVEPDEGPKMPIQRPKRQEPRRRAPRPRRIALLATADDIRRGIVLSEILGPPRAMRDFEI